jgi:hypothetical protein
LTYIHNCLASSIIQVFNASRRLGAPCLPWLHPVVDRITLVAADLVLLHAALTLAVAMVVVALRVAVAPPTSRVGGPSNNNSYNRPQCQVCLKIDHTAKKRRYQYEEDSSFEPRTTALASSGAIDNNWYTNFGATDHITGNLDKLTMHDPYCNTDQIHTSNRSGMDNTCVGNSIIPTPTRNLTLNNVLHVPTSYKNLISVHRFTLDNDTFIEFHPYVFFIKDRKMRRLLLHGPCKGGLYPLPPPTSKFRKLVFSAIKIPIDRWHSRLGHPSRDIVRHVVSKNNLPCAQLDGSSVLVCDACACAKAHQFPYSVSSSSSSAPLELIYSDVWGPTIDYFGCKNYYVSFIDDYSKFTWIYLLHHKSEVSKYFVEF